jgi:drug/metabolite transporter (DMT)-like permease
MGSKPSQSALPAILALLFSATLWGLIWYPLRKLELAGLNGLWTSLLMYTAALVIAVPYLVRQRAAILAQPGVFLLIALLSGWTNIAFILAVIEGNVVRVMLLFYLSPLWATLFARFFLGEKLTARGLFMLGLALLGAVLMLWRPEQLDIWLLTPAEWLGLSAGMGFAATNVAVRYAHAMPIGLKSSAAWLGACVLAVIGLWLTDVSMPVVSNELLMWTFVLGGIGMMLMTLSVQYGVTHMPVQRSAIILLFELVVATVAAQILTNEAVSSVEWAGGICIIAASMIAAYQQAED